MGASGQVTWANIYPPYSPPVCNIFGPCSFGGRTRVPRIFIKGLSSLGAVIRASALTPVPPSGLLLASVTGVRLPAPCIFLISAQASRVAGCPPGVLILGGVRAMFPVPGKPPTWGMDSTGRGDIEPTPEPEPTPLCNIPAPTLEPNILPALHLANFESHIINAAVLAAAILAE